MSDVRDPIEYLLNRMEAARDAKPPTVNYPPARQAVVDHVVALRKELADTRALCTSLAQAAETARQGLGAAVNEYIRRTS